MDNLQNLFHHVMTNNQSNIMQKKGKNLDCVYRIYPCIMRTFFYKNNRQNRGAYYTRILFFVKHVLICVR